jgi:hypothetical protein
MKDRKVIYKLFWVIFLFPLGCNTRNITDLTSDREAVHLTLLHNNKFKYRYYKLAGMNFEYSKRFFCYGNYNVISKNEYELTPVEFYPDSIETKVKISEFSKNQHLHLIFNTDIDDDKKQDYTISVYTSFKNFQFKGPSVDTVISDDVGAKIRFQISLPYFYEKGKPSAVYSKLSTSDIQINGAKEVKIYTPITLDYFYYFNPGKMNIRETSKYYYVNNLKIPKE